MKILDVVCTPVTTGFFRDDQSAIREGRTHNGFLYTGSPVTPGFVAIREPGVAVSVLLILEDGQIAFGDCAEVQYAGAGGRAPLSSLDELIAQLHDHVIPRLIGRTFESFRAAAQEIDGLLVDGELLATSVRYGVTQALLHAAALASGLTMAEVVQFEYSVDAEIDLVPLFAQTGDDRYANVDKMILKQVEALPHGLINEVDTKLGRSGELLLEYVEWLRERVLTVRPNPDYFPRLHIDTYGTIGIAFEGDLERVVTYLASLARVAAPFGLWVEHPIDAGNRDSQVATYAKLREMLRNRAIPVEIVVDEWCNTLEDIDVFTRAQAADVIHVKTPDLGGINNTIEALLLVRERGFRSYSGGTCNETDQSARVTTHVAMACGADQVLAKPGMGVDEGIMIVRNEMARTRDLVRWRRAQQSVQVTAT
ncbi:MAG: methylaspartate ammonia-lyase [Acidobacteria bacterium]|nr:methylaspartate ammonia-lyase [Acidobacteriota bacterium]